MLLHIVTEQNVSTTKHVISQQHVFYLRLHVEGIIALNDNVTGYVCYQMFNVTNVCVTNIRCYCIYI
jgi:hypothetical protein